VTNGLSSIGGEVIFFLTWIDQSCSRASFRSPNPAHARSHKPEPGPSPTFIFEAQFRPKSLIYRVSQDMPNCGLSKNVVYGVGAGRAGLSKCRARLEALLRGPIQWCVHKFLRRVIKSS